MKTRIITAVIAMATCLACNNEEPLTTSGVDGKHVQLPVSHDHLAQHPVA